jgi:hypothetical protein
MEGHFYGRKWYLERHIVTISTNAGTKAVLYEAPFAATPDIKIIKPDGADGTYTAASSSRTGFTITVASETVFDAQDIAVFIFVMEKP